MMTIAATSPASTELLSVFAAVGLGTGSIFITMLLVYLLAYLNVVEASERRRDHLRSLLIAMSVPLVFVFTGVIIFQSLRIIDLL